MARFGRTSDELGFDDDMLAAGWCGFDSAHDFVNTLDQEYLVGSRLEPKISDAS